VTPSGTVQVCAAPVKSKAGEALADTVGQRQRNTPQSGESAELLTIEQVVGRAATAALMADPDTATGASSLLSNSSGNNNLAAGFQR
jgi:hypothetical protein